MIARAYWHWLFTWKPKRHAISRLGTQQKAPRFLGVFLGGPLIMMEFSAKFCNSKVLISELLTWRNWKPKLSLAGHEHFMAEYMFRILFAEDITPPLNRLWRCCTTIVALLGKWWSWQLWLWDDYDQPLAVRELPFFCFGTSLNPATLVKIPVLWRHNHRRRTCPSPLPTRKNDVWKVLSNLSLASPLGRIKIPHELYTWLKSWLLVIVIVAEMNTNSTPKPFGLSPHPSGNHGVHIQFLLDLGFMNKGLSKPVDSLFGLTIIHIQFKWSLTNGFWVTQTLQTSPDYPYPIPNCIEIGLSWHLQWFRI